MKKNEQHLEFPGLTPEKLQFGCLLALGIMELALVAFGPALSYLPYFVVESFSAIPAFLFLGTVLISRQSAHAKRTLLAGVAAGLWIVLAQVLQRLAGEGPENSNLHWAAYLLAFPFAAVEQKRGRGLKQMAAMATAAALMLTLYAGLLKLHLLPAALSRHVFWDGPRLLDLWHPNVTACTLMIGIAFCLGCTFRAENNWKKGLLLAAAAAQFAALALTNSRTNILMTCALMAGVVFFEVFRGSWKQLILGGVAVAAVFVGLFMLTDAIYGVNYEQIVAEYLEEQETESGFPEEETGEKSSPSEEKTEVALPSQSGQGSFLDDMKTLNGRTTIWSSAFRAVRWNPKLMVHGTAYVGDAISAIEGCFPVEHAHNSWMQMLVGFGLPGLLLALYFTFLAVRGAAFVLLRLDTEMWQKCVALLVLCLLMAGFLEPFLFAGNLFYHLINVIFFLCTGYVDLWRAEVRHPERV